MSSALGLAPALLLVLGQTVWTPPPRPPKPLHDAARVLDFDQQREVARLLESQLPRGRTIWVATFPLLSRAEAGEASRQLAETWGLEPRGVLLLYFDNIKQVRVEVGSELTDELSAFELEAIQKRPRAAGDPQCSARSEAPTREAELRPPT